MTDTAGVWESLAAHPALFAALRDGSRLSARGVTTGFLRSLRFVKNLQYVQVYPGPLGAAP